MRIWNALILAVGMIALAAAAGCASASPAASAPTASDYPTVSAAPAVAADPTVSRQDVLASLTADVIAPRFETAAAEMNALRDSLHTLCGSPTGANLQIARDAWRGARGAWMRSQAMWFGPVMDRRSRSLVDWAPVEPSRIEDLLAKRDDVTAEYVREFLASTQRGLGSVEYIIFGDEAAALDALTAGGGGRCRYLTAVGDVAAAELDGVVADWTVGNAESVAYAGYFDGTAESSLLGRSAVAEVVRTSVFLARSITDMRLGKALGVGDDVIADPAAIPMGAAHNAVADMRNQVLGMRDLYVGADGGLGLGALIAGLSGDADERMRAAFENALEAIGQLEEPLHASMAQNPTAAQAAHARLTELKRALNTEVVSLLDVSVGFADTDGDGG